VLILIALAGVEVGARILFGTPMPERMPLLTMRANRERGWEMVPGVQHYTYLHPVHVNELGLRGRQIPLREQARDELRVLALGDSLLYGQGLADADTLPARLEGELVRRDPARRRWRVVNGGHRGYDTRQELALARELGPAIDPDVVVMFWHWNDLMERNDIEATYHRLAGSGPIVFDLGAPPGGSEERAWRLRQILRRSALVMTAYDRWRARSQEAFDPSFIEEGFGRLTEDLRGFRELAQRGGFRPLMAAIPAPKTAVAEDFSAEFARRACRAADDSGVPALSLR
jgi:lysophospholipase L1-like esterase